MRIKLPHIYSSLLKGSLRIFVMVVLFIGKICAQNQQDFPCTCTNGDFETGSFANWTGKTGWINPPIVMTANGIVNGRHTIMSGNGLDPNSCGKVKVNAPGTGVFSARLGNSFVGAEAERLRFTFKVDTNNYLFIYKYAVILEDPGHPIQDQPRFEVSLLNGANQVIDPTCGHYLFVSGTNMGSQWKNCGTVRYKDWEIVGLDLTAYDGQTITIEFTTADCAQGGHFGYAYLDAFCSPLKVTTKYCTGANTAILTAPDGFKYVWTPGNLTTKSITINNPVNGTVYTCHMTSILNPTCKATIKSVLQPIDVIANFTTSSLCYNNVQFNDASVTPTNTVISGWKWTFGDPPSGPKNSSTISSPTHSYSADGVYNVTFVATNNAGCTDTVVKQIVTVPVPDAKFTATDVCLGVATSFTDNSTLKSGTITSWTWDFGDNSTLSNLANPTHTYALPGPYNVSLIVSSSNGCSDTLKKQVMVYPKPVPSFTTNSLCLKASSVFQNTSTVMNGSLQGWKWNFGEPSSGPQNTSLLQNPSHAFNTCGGFNVKLVVITDKSCRDSIVTPIVVDCLPKADFSLADICKENPSVFTDQSTVVAGTINKWLWNFGNTDSANTASPVYTYPACGLYNVSLIVTTGSGCKDTATKPINIFCKPNADFTTNNVCFNQQPVKFTDKSSISSGIIMTYSWDLGDGSVSNVPIFTHNYSGMSSYSVNLITTSDHGCKDTINKQITIFPSPKASFSSSLVCLNSSTLFTDHSSVIGSVINTWDWKFGDGSKSAVKDPVHFFNMVSTYNVSLVVTTTDGCRDSVSNPATVNLKPTAAFTATNVCLNNQTDFANASSIAVGNISSNDWVFGDGVGISNILNPSYNYLADSTYNVKLLVISNTGCRDSISKVVTVYPIPKANFVSTKVCLKNQNVFSDNSTVKIGNIAFWNWDFGDTSTAVIKNPSHTYAYCGDFTASLSVISNYGCSANISKAVKVYCLPVADFNVPDVCITNASVFTDASSISNGVISNWNWIFGDGNINNLKNTTNIYQSCGSFNSSLTVTTAEGCKDTKAISAIVHCKPSANFQSSTVCNGNETVFTDMSTVLNSNIANWDWDFGDGLSTTGKDPNHPYANCGFYATNLIVTSINGCKDTLLKPVTVNCKPIADFISTKICMNKTTAFTDQSVISAGSITQHDWDFGDVNTASGLTPAHKYLNCGTYNGTLIITSNLGCKDTVVHPVIVSCGPTSDFSVSSVCLNNANIFTDKSTVVNEVITQWDWDFNEPSSGIFNTSSNPNDTHTYSACGVYNARLITTSSNGCKDTIVKPLDVYCLPLADFSTQAVCRKISSPFADLSTITSGSIAAYSWDFGDPTSGSSNLSAQANPNHIFTSCGNFDVTFTAFSDHQCSNTIKKPALVHCLPQPAFTAPGVCQNYTSSFWDNSTIFNDTINGWNWKYDDASPDSFSQNPSHLYTLAGTYNVMLIPTSVKGCKDTIVQEVNVFSLPTAAFLADTVCFGTPVNFHDQSSTVPGDNLIAWNWDFGDSNSSLLQNPQNNYAQQGTFPVSLIVTSNHNCLDTALADVEVYPIPVALFNDSASGCVPLNASFSDLSTIARGNITSWLWDFGNGDFGGAKNVSYLYDPQITTPIVYNVSLTVTSDHGCRNTYTRPRDIKVYPLPIANFKATPAVTSFFKSNILFNDLSIGNGALISWDWDFGDNFAANTQNVSHNYLQPGVYSIKLIVENIYGCLDTIRKLVDIQPEFTFYVPNAFTPDGDGVNDYFFGTGIGITEYRMDIFDRWGNKIFTTLELKTGWNGKANGGKSTAQQDVYVYVVNLTDVFGEKHKYIGHCSLIR